MNKIYPQSNNSTYSMNYTEHTESYTPPGLYYFQGNIANVLTITLQNLQVGPDKVSST